MQKLQSRIDGVNTPRVGYIAISRVYHIFAKNIKLGDLIKYALLQYGGCGLTFCTAFRISPSGAISGWIIGEIRQHQNFDCGPYPRTTFRKKSVWSFFKSLTPVAGSQYCTYVHAAPRRWDPGVA